MSLYEDLNELENTNGNIDKEYKLFYILKKYKNAELFFRIAFNDVKYGIQEQTFKNAFNNPNHEFEHISDWLNSIEVNTIPDNVKVTDLGNFIVIISNLSGNDQIIELRKFFDNLPAYKKKWFCRAILKDLRCGVQVKTINKVFKHLNLKTIEKFSLQLCDKIDVYDEEQVKKKIKFPCSMECKYDGIRIQVEIYESSATLSTQVRLTSRRGTDRTNDFPEICAELKRVFEGENIILDGEIIADTFQKLTRKDDKSIRKYVIFDLLVDEKLEYRHRWSNLLSLLVEKGITDLTGNKNIKYNSNLLAAVEHYSANNIKDLQEYYEELNRRKEEGLIIKLENSPYERNSRKHMFKVKKVYSTDLLIYGFKYGEGKRSNKVATLCLKDKSGKILVDVGSGIDDYTCEELTKQAKELSEDNNPEFIGKICEILYNEKTETGSLRFPRFIRIRDDKDEPDDLGN